MNRRILAILAVVILLAVAAAGFVGSRTCRKPCRAGSHADRTCDRHRHTDPDADRDRITDRHEHADGDAYGHPVADAHASRRRRRPTPTCPSPFPACASGTSPAARSTITSYWEETDAFTRYYITYPSDDLLISGMMAVPKGQGPFPVIILNHGYIAPSQYWIGADTYDASTYLASRGFLTISPDFRGWGRSDTGENVFRSGLAIDVMNLISSLPSLPQADPDRVGIWGHSMGGGAVSWTMAVDPRVKASLLYAPVSADASDRRRFGGSGPPAAATPFGATIQLSSTRFPRSTTSTA